MPFWMIPTHSPASKKCNRLSWAIYKQEIESTGFGHAIHEDVQSSMLMHFDIFESLESTVFASKKASQCHVVNSNGLGMPSASKMLLLAMRAITSNTLS